MYTHGHGEKHLIVGVRCTGGDMKVLVRFKREMSKNFKMSDLSVLSYYLDIEVQKSTAGITIFQGAYVKKLLETASLADQ